MKIERFEEILAWQKARVMTIAIYKILEASHDYGFKDQIQRASVSVMNNIAEGFERHSDKEFLFFLNVAKASCGEVRSMLYLAKDLGKIPEAHADELMATSLEISKMIAGLMKSLRV